MIATTRKGNSPSSRMRPIPATPRWREVNGGLRLVALGYLLLFLLGLPGLTLAWLARHDVALFGLRLGAYQDSCTRLGVCLAGSALLGAYALLLLGQWRCLACAPQRHSARELAFVCVLCLLVGPFTLTAAHYTGGSVNYVLWEKGAAGLDELEPFGIGGIFQLTGLALVLLNLLFFTQVMRVIATSLTDETTARRGEIHLYAVCGLVGVSVGAPFYSQDPPSRPYVFAGLVLAWLLCLAWHAFLIVRTRRCITATLIHLGASSRLGGHRADGRNRLKTYSGLHRI